MTTLEQHMLQVRELAESVCEALRKQVFDLGLPVDFIDPDVNRAEYSLSRDPASGKDSLIGIWRDAKGQKQGEILFHADGSFFAEYDVISEHPEKPRWFIEAVTAWGRDNMLKAEPRLLPLVE